MSSPNLPLRIIISVTLAMTFIGLSSAQAGIYRLLHEHITDQVGGGDVVVNNYNSLAAILNDTRQDVAPSAIDINPTWNVVSFTYDGQYRLLLESNSDQPGGSELFAELTDQPVSDHFMHDTFEQVGVHAGLEDVIQSGKRHGMQTMNDSVNNLLKAGKISPEVAAENTA